MGLQKDIELDSGFSVGFHDIEELRIDFRTLNCQARVASYKNKAAKNAGKKPHSLDWVSFQIDDVAPTLRKAIQALKMLPRFEGSIEPE